MLCVMYLIEFCFCSLESIIGLVFRFVIGYIIEGWKMKVLEEEVEKYKDFMFIDIDEKYKKFNFKM